MQNIKNLNFSRLTKLEKFLFKIIIILVLMILLLVYKGDYIQKIIKMFNKPTLEKVEIRYSNLQNTTYVAKNSIFSGEYEKSDVVFIGDSLTDLFEWSYVFSGKISNRGISGDTTEGVLNRLSDIKKLNPDILFIMIGTNDVDHNISEELIVDNYRRILIELSTMESTKIYVESILPTKNVDYNKKIVHINEKVKEICNSMNIDYLDLYNIFLDDNGLLNEEISVDRVHLNYNGYEKWISVLKKYIQ